MLSQSKSEISKLKKIKNGQNKAAICMQTRRLWLLHICWIIVAFVLMDQLVRKLPRYGGLSEESWSYGKLKLKREWGAAYMADAEHYTNHQRCQLELILSQICCHCNALWVMQYWSVAAHAGCVGCGCGEGRGCWPNGNVTKRAKASCCVCALCVAFGQVCPSSYPSLPISPLPVVYYA